MGMAAVAAAFAAIPAPAAQFTAPLPEGYQPSGQHLVLGLYAEVNGLTSIFDDQQIEELETSCRAVGKTVTWQDRDKHSAGAVRIYRTEGAVAVIRDDVRLMTDPKTCVARYVVERQANVRTGEWRYQDVPNFEDPDFECENRRIGRRCSEETVAGIKVTCLDHGDGLVGSVSCVSRRKDLTRGLLFSHSSYVDDDSMPTGGWALTRVEPTALIDPTVFRPAPKN